MIKTFKPAPTSISETTDDHFLVPKFNFGYETTEVQVDRMLTELDKQ
jgi:hypothetical protein